MSRALTVLPFHYNIITTIKLDPKVLREVSVPVNRSNRVPLYAQLEATLRTQISSGSLKPGDWLPSEAELGQRYGISRITVRAALQQLEEDGLVERQAGKGTQVKASEVEPWSCLTSFTQQMMRIGRVPRTKLLKVKTIVLDPELKSTLQLKPGEPAVLIERLRLVDEEPAALMRAYIPLRFVPGISRKDFPNTGKEQSILYVLEKRYGLLIDEGEETTAPVCLTQPDAGLLGLAEGSPVIYKACVIRNRLGEPVLYEKAYWCKPQTELVRRVTTATD